MSRGKPTPVKSAPPKRKVSARKLAANRANGKKGGRPTAHLPPHMLEALGPAPIVRWGDNRSLLRMNRWYANALLMLTELRLGGVGVDSLADHVRKNAGVAAKLTPTDYMFEAQRRVDADDREMQDDWGPEEEEVERAPTEKRGHRCDA